MKYLSFVRSSEKSREVQPPAPMMEAMGKLIEKFTITSTDGPFVESKELIGGWARSNEHIQPKGVEPCE